HLRLPVPAGRVRGGVAPHPDWDLARRSTPPAWAGAVDMARRRLSGQPDPPSRLRLRAAHPGQSDDRDRRGLWRRALFRVYAVLWPGRPYADATGVRRPPVAAA